VKSALARELGCRGEFNSLKILPIHLAQHFILNLRSNTNTKSSSLEEVITLVVGEGEGQAKLIVHKDVLCSASPFFQAACKPEWMTAEDKVITLPEDDPEAVKALIHWMYHDEICADEKKTNVNDANTEEEAMRGAWGVFVKLFVLGQKYQIPPLQNDAIDAILVHVNTWSIELGVISYAYENTSSGSPLRRLLVRLVRLDDDDLELMRFKNNLCQEFLFELTMALFKAQKSPSKRAKRRDNSFCKNFHKHKAGEPRCKILKSFTTFSPADSSPKS
jgi:hypothetical protein